MGWGQISGAIAIAILLAQDKPPSEVSGGDFKISTTVERVVLPVTVRGRDGELVKDLEKESFRVYEDGQLQEIRLFSNRDVPVSVGLVVDSSSSMRAKKVPAILAALNFVRMSNPQDEIFVVNFNENVRFGLPEGKAFSNDAGELNTALAEHPADGKTALYDAIAEALDHLSKGQREKKTLLVISDGGDNASRRGFREVLQKARESEAIIYAVGLYSEREHDQEDNPGVLKRLAQETGGEALFTGAVEDVSRVCGHIARELRSQYTIGYAPERKAAGYRRIQVVASAAGHGRLKVRTRAGYVAGEGTQQAAERPR